MQTELGMASAEREEWPVDREGASAFRAHEQHMRTLKIALVMTLVALVAVSVGAVFAISRPLPVSIIRVDNVRGAELVRSFNTSLDIRTAETRTALWNWCLWRYRILKSSARDDFRQSYYFLSPDLISQHRGRDAEKVASILAGSDPEQTVDVRTVVIPPLKAISVGSRKVLRGRAQIELITRENPTVPEAQDNTKHLWRVDLEYIVDPIDSAKKGVDDPQYQILNPLGITITSYYETREPDLLEAR